MVVWGRAMVYAYIYMHACAHSPVFLKINIHGGNKALRYNFGQSKEYPSISNKITPHKNFNPLLSQTEPQDGDSPLNAVCPLELTQYIFTMRQLKIHPTVL